MDQVKILLSCLKPLLKKPTKIPQTLITLISRWHSGGLLGLKIALTEVRDGTLAHGNEHWDNYQQRLKEELQPYILKKIPTMVEKPLISVLMPTFNTPPQLLKKTIESINGQWYPNWELCISDDGSTNSKTLQLLKQLEKENNKIKVIYNKINKNISCSTNVALSMAKGEYVVFIDHDDLLEPQALYRVAELALSKQPDFIYSDEILISKNGKSILDYVLRPSFSLEKLRTHPYIVHFIAFKTEFLRGIGGLNEKLSISQDYDLILRTAENTQKIVHIPEILYQWRTLRNSAGHQMQDKVMATSTDILQQHLQRMGEEANIVDSGYFNFFDIRYPIKQKAKVAIIIPTKNCADIVKQCIRSFDKTIHNIDYDIIIIDHQSDEPESIAYFESIKNKHTIIPYQGEFNYSAINNYAVKQINNESNGKNYTHLLFCNNDIEAIEEGWLERMLELGQQKDIAIVGAKLLYPENGEIQHAGVGVGIFAAAEHYGKFVDNKLASGQKNPGKMGSLIANHEVSAVTAACLLIKTEVFKEIKGFDESLAVGFGDTDLCLRVRALGYRVIFCPHATLLHYESYSRGINNDHEDDTQKFRQRWEKYMLEGDPYFNPNFLNDTYSWVVKMPIAVNKEINYRFYS
jgi:GT2 family glycosyltransferase